MSIGRVQDGVDRVDDGVGDVDELQFVAVADRHRPAGVHLHEVVLDAELLLALDLLFDQLDGKRRRDDRRVVAVGELRDCPDVVEVAVCRHDGLHVALQIGHDAIVRDRAHVDEIERVHPLGFDVVVDQHLREIQPHVEDDDVVAGTHRRHLAADFFVASDCCDFDLHCITPRKPPAGTLAAGGRSHAAGIGRVAPVCPDGKAAGYATATSPEPRPERTLSRGLAQSGPPARCARRPPHRVPWTAVCSDIRSL
jgi:hypothetical protein